MGEGAPEAPVSLPLTIIWNERRQAQQQRELDSLLAQPAAEAPAAAEPTMGRPVASPLESTSEAVRAKASAEQAAQQQTPALAEGMARLFGFKDAAEAQQRLSNGEFGVGDAMRIGDVVGNISRGLSRERAEAAGLPPDLAEKMGGAISLGAVLWPAGPINKIQKINDVVHWAYLQSLLSNPATHSANILGTGGAVAMMYPERYVAEWINQTFFRSAEGVQRGETWAMMRAGGSAIVNGLRMLGRAIKTGEKPFGPGRIEPSFELSAAHFGIDPKSPLGVLTDTVGALAPTRLMMAEDAFYKGFIYTSEIHATALAEAVSEGLQGKELAKQTAFYTKNPTPWMIDAAQNSAVLNTLNAPLGELGQAVMKVRNMTPGASFLFPFLQTPVNSFKWMWRRTPGLSMLSTQNWRDIAQGGATRDLALSRMAIGNAVGAAVTWQVLQGNITGALPTGANKELKRDARELGLVPFTIRAGDESYDYHRSYPIGQYISSIATAVEIYSQISARDPQAFSWGDFAIAAGLAGSRIAMDTPLLQNLTDVLEAIEKPDVNSKKVLLSLARSAVPGALQQATRMGVPGLNEPHPELRELDTILDAVKSGIPWMVTGVAPVIHPITGDPIMRPPGWGPDLLSPVAVTHRKDDPVLQEIVKNQMNFSEPSKKIGGPEDNPLSLDPTITPTGVPLTQQEYYRLKQIATRVIEDGDGNLMHEAMLKTINSEEYRNAVPGPDGGQEARLKMIYNKFYKQARLQLLKEDDKLAALVRAQKETTIQRKFGSGQRPANIQITPR